MNENKLPASPKDEEHDKYEVEHALRTLKEADKIKKNTKLMKAVSKLAGEEMNVIRSIADLEDAREELVKKDDQEPQEDE